MQRCCRPRRRVRNGDVGVRSDLPDLISAAIGIEAECADRIARQCEVVVYGPNSVIYFQEDDTECLYLVITGYVRSQVKFAPDQPDQGP